MSLLIMVSLAISIDSGADQNIGAETINMKKGVIFTHKKHQTFQNSECSQCHQLGNWKIENWGQEVAHTMCISCHDLSEKGPMKCDECHK